MKLSDGEKLIIMMLTHIYAHLKIKVSDKFDTGFIREAITSDNAWGIRQQYPGIFGGDESNPEEVSEVYKILSMWDLLEREYGALKAAEKKSVKDGLGISADVKFLGFDGNNETTQIGIARFIVDRMDQFERFKKRDLNSHLWGSLDGYRRMLPVFDQRLKNASDGELKAADVVEIIKARRAP